MSTRFDGGQMYCGTLWYDHWKIQLALHLVLVKGYKEVIESDPYTEYTWCWWKGIRRLLNQIHTPSTLVMVKGYKEVIESDPYTEYLGDGERVQGGYWIRSIHRVPWWWWKGTRRLLNQIRTPSTLVMVKGYKEVIESDPYTEYLGDGERVQGGYWIRSVYRVHLVMVKGYKEVIESDPYTEYLGVGERVQGGYWIRSVHRVPWWWWKGTRRLLNQIHTPSTLVMVKGYKEVIESDPYTEYLGDGERVQGGYWIRSVYRVPISKLVYRALQKRVVRRWRKRWQ